MVLTANPYLAPSASLKALAASLFNNRQLIYQMTKREVTGRYRGTLIGIVWSLMNPVLMLTIYTFVFSMVFKARWGLTSSESKTEFALILFVGLIVFTLFAETINRAPSLILSNVNYVKKVVFPLEILPFINFYVAFLHALISFAVLLMAFFLLNGYLNWTIIFLPIVLIPFVLLTLGTCWFIASLGVFVRDVGHTIGAVTTLLMFLSPVFYPISAVPVNFQIWIYLNPLSFIIEQVRAVLMFGTAPDWRGLCIYFLISLIVLASGFAWFQKTRKGFSDVL
jgi:lipopolysaccharide transport system permease protein